MSYTSNKILVENDDLIVEVDNFDNVDYNGYGHLLNSRNTNNAVTSSEKPSKVTRINLTDYFKLGFADSGSSSYQLSKLLN